MNELPGKLRLELSNVLYQHEVKGINYFKDKSAHFIASVAPLLRPVNLTKGEYVYMSGDPLDAGKNILLTHLIYIVYFIKSGETAYVQTK